LRPNVIVKVTHQDKPLSGVTVLVTGMGTQVFTGRTEADGAVHISNVPVGDYWLKAELLGISAAYTCFHVSPSPSRKARKKLKFEWGDMPPETQQIAGRLQTRQLGKGSTLVERVRHPVDVPIRNASLILRSPVNDAVYRAASDQDGNFSFTEIPAGTYVLHVEGGALPNEDTSTQRDALGPDDFVLHLTASAKPGKLVLTPNLGGGSCGGWSLALGSM
jgi:WD40 repeat protein